MIDENTAREIYMRVLIVEDDDALGMFLQKCLKLEGHDVLLVGDGQSGLDHVLAHAPELLVLDLTLPRLDGIQVLEGLQGRLEKTSVLVLSGRTDLEERVKCLELGADDCLRKPFSFNELTARCRALCRRRQQIVDTTLRHRGIEVNRMERRVTREGQVIELTGKEFALLEFLMQARGRCCTRSELLREVWQMSPDAGTNVVDVYVNYLRKKLGAARPGGISSNDQVIETVRGEGYMIGMGVEKKSNRLSVPDGLQGVMRGPDHGVFGMGSRYIA
jgi:DNA-binding response OmpR family regulator